MNQYVESRQVERVVHTIRNIAPDEMGVRLYGINKWANENDIDIVIHVHFNDYPGRPRTGSGKYSGFSILFQKVSIQMLRVQNLLPNLYIID